MTKLNNVTAIFKRNLVFKQLKKLLNKEGFNVTSKKDVKKIEITDLKKSILIIELLSEKELQHIFSFFKKKSSNAFILFILQKKLEFPVNFRNSKILIQPLTFDELLRNLIMLQKSFNENRATIKFSNLNYYPLDSKLIDNRNGNVIELTDLENKLISFLLDNNQGCSKSEILKNVWQHSAELNTHTMESLIYRLRRKIENDPNKPKILVQTGNKYFLKST